MIEKKIITAVPLFTGNVDMPKGWHLEKDEMVKNITIKNYYEDVKDKFYKTIDRLETFIREYMHVDHRRHITRGDGHYPYGRYYEKNEISKPMLEVNPFNLKASPDWVCLYGVEIDPGSCKIIITYNDNRKKGKKWIVDLETNKFVMFPATLEYYIENKNNSYLNYIQTLTYVDVGDVTY
jgi:hypothetical protein